MFGELPRPSQLVTVKALLSVLARQAARQKHANAANQRYCVIRGAIAACLAATKMIESSLSALSSTLHWYSIKQIVCVIKHNAKINESTVDVDQV